MEAIPEGWKRLSVEEQYEVLAAALEAMAEADPDLAWTFIQLEYHDRMVTEIAVDLGITPGAVTKRRQRAMREMQGLVRKATSEKLKTG